MTRAGVRWAAVAVALLLVTAACGTGENAGSTDDASKPTVTTTVERAPGDPKLAGEAITAFGNDLFKATAAEAPKDKNVVVSPASVAIALAMLEPGATGSAQTELRKLLRIEDPAAFHTSMGALEKSVEERKAGPAEPDEKPGEVTMSIANAAYVMKEYPIKPTYLEAIKNHYGPAVPPIDFAKSAAAAREVNKFIADATRDRIKDLVKDDTFDKDTVMALVNALYLKASWQETFDKAETQDKPFTRLDDRRVTVPLMSDSSGSSNRGPNWVGATKSYVGGLVAQFILPNDGAFDAVVRDLPKVLADYKTRTASGAKLVVPRFETRTETSLTPPLKALGMNSAYSEGHLLGVADDERLKVDDVLHATFLAMDEEGTEAAAATVVVLHAVSGPVDPPAPVPVILDRPFLFRIYDSVTGATLFIGRVLDPTA